MFVLTSQDQDPKLTEQTVSESHRWCSFLDGLVDERLVDVGDDTTTSDGALDKGVQLFITADRQLEVAGRDALHLEIFARVPSQLKDLCCQVLQDRCRVHSRGCSHPAAGLDPFFQLAMDTPDGELHVTHNESA